MRQKFSKKRDRVVRKQAYPLSESTSRRGGKALRMNRTTILVPAETQSDQYIGIHGDTQKNFPPAVQHAGTSWAKSGAGQERIIKINERQVRWRARGAKKDFQRASMKVLDPTNPTHVVKWSKHPGNFDMLGIDTPNRGEDVIEIYRGVHISRLARDLTVKQLQHHSSVGVGKSWTGNLGVARIYSINGCTTIASPAEMAAHHRASDITAKTLSNQSKETPDVYMPWAGIVFRLEAKAAWIDDFNPESYPWEQEARMNDPPIEWSKDKDGLKIGYERNAIKQYPGLQLGFVLGDEGKRIEFHKLRAGDEDVPIRVIYKREPNDVVLVQPAQLLSAPDAKIRRALELEYGHKPADGWKGYAYISTRDRMSKVRIPLTGKLVRADTSTRKE